MKLKKCSMMALCAAFLLANCSKDGVNGKTTLTKTSKEPTQDFKHRQSLLADALNADRESF